MHRSSPRIPNSSLELPSSVAALKNRGGVLRASSMPGRRRGPLELYPSLSTMGCVGVLSPLPELAFPLKKQFLKMLIKIQRHLLSRSPNSCDIRLKMSLRTICHSKRRICHSKKKDRAGTAQTVGARVLLHCRRCDELTPLGHVSTQASQATRILQQRPGETGNVRLCRRCGSWSRRWRPSIQSL